MNKAFRTAEDYELYLYSLPDLFPSIRRSTVTFVRLGATLARVAGELFFDSDIRVVVRERFVYHRLPAVLDWYGYEVWRHDEKLYWYDPQLHPDDRELQSIHPHHKHIPPDIKHHRIPAPGMSFEYPNLPLIITEVERLIQELSGASTAD